MPFFQCLDGEGERWINVGPTSEGPELLAVEYTQPLVIDGMPWLGEEEPPALPPNPRLFDDEVEFLGPFFDDPNAPWHYNLFVWLWRGNPTGVFEPLNPDVRCP